MKFERDMGKQGQQVKRLVSWQEFVTVDTGSIGVLLPASDKQEDMSHRRVCWLKPPSGERAFQEVSVNADLWVQPIDTVLHWKIRPGGEA